jgi:hypothetical protein
MATHAGDLSEINPHLALWQSENYVSPGERAWLAWVAKAEKLLGHDLDGDNSEAAKVAGTSCGYSLDEAHDAFADGVTVEEYAAEVMAEKAALAAQRGAP